MQETQSSDKAFWTGFGLVLLTSLFLMGLVAADSAGYAIRCSSRGPIVLLFSLAAGSGAAFIGGSATASGNTPFFKNSPMKLALTGGLAILVISLGLGFRLYANEACGSTAAPTVASVAQCKDVYIHSFANIFPPEAKGKRLILDFDGHPIPLAPNAGIEHSLITLENYDPGQYDLRVLVPKSAETVERVVQTTRTETRYERVPAMEFREFTVAGMIGTVRLPQPGFKDVAVAVPVVDFRTEKQVVETPELTVASGRVALTSHHTFLLRLRGASDVMLDPAELAVTRLVGEAPQLLKQAGCATAAHSGKEAAQPTSG